METKTSRDSPIRLDRVVPENAAKGWVAVTLAPGKQTMGTYNFWNRDLYEDLAMLRALGTTLLVSLLTDYELSKLKIPNLVEAAHQRELVVLRHPIEDGSVPTDMKRFMFIVQRICRQYELGWRIVVHCNGGLGRAGMVAACVRLALGLDENPAQAIAVVRQIRSERAIETQEQSRFIEEFRRRPLPRLPF